LNQSPLIVLGGQHQVAACLKSVERLEADLQLQKLVSADVISILRSRNCVLYADLSLEAQIFVSKEHQKIQQETCGLSFQDKV